MLKNIKQAIILLFIIPPVNSLAADLKSIDGIWQDESRENAYYSIFHDGNTIVIIDLPLLEFTGELYTATYIGSMKDISAQNIIVSPISFPTVPINIIFSFRHRSNY